MRKKGSGSVFMHQVPRFLRTVMYLRAGQIYHRLAGGVRWPRKCQGITGIRAWPTTASPGWMVRPSAFTSPDTFELLNQVGMIGKEGPWYDANRDRLWNYHLHYFDELMSQGADDRRAILGALAERWVDQNPVGVGVGWEPYPLSRRISNWIKWSWQNGQLSDVCNASLAAQTRFLSQRLEWHLTGNHLVANAKALVLAGTYFEGEEADSWLTVGTGILCRQLREQILDDGAHYELSPMYHALVLEDLLDVHRALAALAPVLGTDLCVLEEIGSIVPKARHWLQTMTHGDGHLAQFNDCVHDLAADSRDLSDYAGRCCSIEPDADSVSVATASQGHVRGVWLRHSGYARLTTGRATCIADGAAIGPDHIPGHGHADTLSFEFSVCKQKLFVNGGTSTYEDTERRYLERGSGAHNTLMVDNTDSSEVWGSFRVGRRARIVDADLQHTSDGVMFLASHDGYRHIEQSLLHERQWRMMEGRLDIQDVIGGRRAHGLQVSFRVHPDVRIERKHKTTFVLSAPDVECEFVGDERLSWDIAATTYCPQFNTVLATERLLGFWQGECPMTFAHRVTWVEKPA